MKIAICEDRPEDLAALRSLVAQYCADQRVEADIDCFARGDRLIEHYRPGSYQMVFLDVMMPGITGMAAARAIREVDREVALIFVTVSPDFAAASYFLDAAFYLVKPITAENLAAAMKRCRGLIMENAKAVEITQGRRTVKARLRDITYIDSHRNDCVIHTPHDELRVRAPLASLEEKVGGLPFLRCHQSFLVNLDWVEDMHGKGFLMGNGVVLPISKSYYSHCKEQFNRYIAARTRGEAEE